MQDGQEIRLREERMTEKQKRFLTSLVEEIGIGRFLEVLENEGVNISSLISICIKESEELALLKEKISKHPRFREKYDWRTLLYADREFCDLILENLENYKSIEEELKEAFG